MQKNLFKEKQYFQLLYTYGSKSFWYFSGPPSFIINSNANESSKKFECLGNIFFKLLKNVLWDSSKLEKSDTNMDAPKRRTRQYGH